VSIVYKCSHCGAAGCKLWRDYNTFLCHLELYCVDCAGADQKKDVTDLDARGRRLIAEEYGLGQRTDQIGWLVPAVPTAQMDTYWGYTSVPDDRCQWWHALPNRPVAERTPDEGS
jgi:hypothetical protein